MQSLLPVILRRTTTSAVHLLFISLLKILCTAGAEALRQYRSSDGVSANYWFWTRSGHCVPGAECRKLPQFGSPILRFAASKIVFPPEQECRGDPKKLPPLPRAFPHEIWSGVIANHAFALKNLVIPECQAFNMNGAPPSEGPNSTPKSESAPGDRQGVDGASPLR